MWCAVGGRQSLVGAFLGAVLVAGVQGALSESEAFLETWTLVMGALFVLVVLVPAQGDRRPRRDPVDGSARTFAAAGPAGSARAATDGGAAVTEYLELRDVCVSFNGFLR